ncbi:MAG: hypothetical protein IPF62_09485 [Bacteroidetes bacterium]|nr:hypothetical protein [Bacteroidota bacterium]
MKDNVLAKFILFLRNLFRHGNFDNIDAKFDLLTETGEMAKVDKSYALPEIEHLKIEEPKVEEPKVEDPKVEDPKVEDPIAEQPKIEEPLVNETIQENDKDFSYIDDETLRKIYETIHKINEFEKKSNRLRKLKFAKRDKSI